MGKLGYNCSNQVPNVNVRAWNDYRTVFVSSQSLIWKRYAATSKELKLVMFVSRYNFIKRQTQRIARNTLLYFLDIRFDAEWE